MYVVILAGGSGTRFWPLSRTKTPKQLMSVFGGKSMLQRTLERVLPLKPQRIMVVTNVAQAPGTAAQLSEYDQVQIDIIEEPVGRNTAPAIALAARIIARYDPDGIMLVLPADHYIRKEEVFRRVVLAACSSANSGALMTLGIEPTRPETGYGYIEAGEGGGGAETLPVRRFVEKPDVATAAGFMAAGNFYWNSGMFIWKAAAIEKELARQMPELSAAVKSLNFPQKSLDMALLQPEIDRIYPDLKGESIDYGVMERAENVQVIPAELGWSDVGSWSALPEVIEADEEGNVTISSAGLISLDSRNSLVYGNSKMVALVGVENLIVVDTPDALLVCHSGRAQDVKRVVERLQKEGLKGYL